MTESVRQKQKSFFSRLIQSRALIIAEVVVLIILGVAVGKEVLRKYQIEREIASLESQVDDLENANIQLNSLISYFQSPEYTESQARQKLGMQKQGESVVTVLGVETQAGENESAAASPVQSDRAASVSNPQRWWNYFFSTISS